MPVVNDLTDALFSFENAMRAYEELAQNAVDDESRLKDHFDKTMRSSYYADDISLSEEDERRLIDFSEYALGILQDQIKNSYESRLSNDSSPGPTLAARGSSRQK